MPPDDDRPDRQSGKDLPDDQPRKQAHPLLWLLVLLGLMALGWALYNHHAGHASPLPPPPDATQARPQATPPA